MGAQAGLPPMHLLQDTERGEGVGNARLDAAGEQVCRERERGGGGACSTGLPGNSALADDTADGSDINRAGVQWSLFRQLRLDQKCSNHFLVHHTEAGVILNDMQTNAFTQRVCPC